MSLAQGYTCGSKNFALILGTGNGAWSPGGINKYLLNERPGPLGGTREKPVLFCAITMLKSAGSQTGCVWGREDDFQSEGTWYQSTST